MGGAVVVAAGVPALGTMLVIAVLALVLGLAALWLARRHTRREADRHRARDAGADRTDGPPPV
ncbi:hypothetical protein [Nakamurella deserti]|uniref:hypothetical protein n=1 Tax=Nakamurella deserti TaxID=2164074 RepID=UPI000DBE48AB|nr:hypothetical protein [Nakamurella deserti]